MTPLRHSLGLVGMAGCLALGCARLPCSPPDGLPDSPPSVTGSVHGHVLPADGEASGVVVYLEPVEPGWRQRAPGKAVAVHQGEDASWPTLLAVAAGDRVEFRARNEVHHRIFSYSAPNAFELGVGDAAEAAAVELRHEGVVRFYCSLHPWESGVIVVTPSPWFDTSGAGGSYEIRDVPQGRYRLRTWSGPRASVERIVVVTGGESTAVDLELDVPRSSGS